MDQKWKRRSRKLARQIFWQSNDKNSYKCPDCGRGHDEVRRFEVHHKNGTATDNSISNLVGLCRVCHKIREGKKPSLESVRNLRNSLGSDDTSSIISSPSQTNHRIRDIKYVRKQMNLENEQQVIHRLESLNGRCESCRRATDGMSLFVNDGGLLLCPQCNDEYSFDKTKCSYLSDEEIAEARSLGLNKNQDIKQVESGSELKRGDTIIIISNNCRDFERIFIIETHSESVRYCKNPLNETAERDLKVQHLSDYYKPFDRSILELIEDGRIFKQHNFAEYLDEVGL